MKKIFFCVASLILLNCCDKKENATGHFATPPAENCESKQIDPLDYEWALLAIKKEAYQLTRVVALREKLKLSTTTGESTLYALDLKKESDELDKLKQAADKCLETLQAKLNVIDDKEGDDKYWALMGYRKTGLSLAENYYSQGKNPRYDERNEEFLRLSDAELDAVLKEFYTPSPF